MEKNDYLKTIGNALVLPSILALLLYFLLWAEFGKMFNEIILLGSFLGIISLICLDLAKAISTESLVLGLALFAATFVLATTNLKTFVTGSLIIACFVGATYFTLRENDEIRTALPIKEVHQ